MRRNESGSSHTPGGNVISPEVEQMQHQLAELTQANELLRGRLEELLITQEELRRNEQRYAGILNSQATLIVRADTSNRITYMNAAYERTFGLTIGDTFFVRVHPDDVEKTNVALEQLHRPPFTCTVEQRCSVHGEWRWIHWQDSVIRDRMGKIVEVQGVGFDVHERKRAEEALRESERHFKALAESNRRLLLELDHRVRNNLSGLLGLLSVMRHQTRDVDTFADALRARLIAMAHSHELLAQADGQAMDLRRLLTSLLATMHGVACHEVPVQMEGPDICISQQQAHPLTMVFLELFTNSCKYGAHSSPTGRLEVTWDARPLDGATRVRLRWRESGGPPIHPPVRTSLGSELIRSFVTRELGGECLLRFQPDGVDHVLVFSSPSTPEIGSAGYG